MAAAKDGRPVLAAGRRAVRSLRAVVPVAVARVTASIGAMI
jgi:hypothetical protein